MPTPLESIAASIEPDMARRVATGLRKMRERVAINDLAMALAARDSKRALALLSTTATLEDLAPVATATRDAVLKGGRLEGAALRKALR